MSYGIVYKTSKRALPKALPIFYESFEAANQGARHLYESLSMLEVIELDEEGEYLDEEREVIVVKLTQPVPVGRG